MPPFDITRIVPGTEPVRTIDVSGPVARLSSTSLSPANASYFLPVLCIPLALGANPFVQSAGAWLAAKGYQLVGKREQAADVAFARGQALGVLGQELAAYHWYARARAIAPMASAQFHAAGAAAYAIAIRNAEACGAKLRTERLLGQYDPAHTWYTRAAAVATSLDDAARVHESIAAMLYLPGERRPTILESRRDTFDPPTLEAYYLHEARALESAAVVRSKMEQFDRAADHYARAAEIREECGDVVRARQALTGQADALIAQAGRCQDLERRIAFCTQATVLYAEILRRIAAGPLEHEQAEMMIHQAEQWESIGEWSRAAELYVTLTYAAEGVRHTRGMMVDRYVVARLRALQIPVGASPSGDIVQAFAHAFTVVCPERSSTALTTGLFTQLLKEAERCAQRLSDTLRDAAAAELWALIAANAGNTKVQGDAWRSCLSRLQAAAQTETLNNPYMAHTLYQKAVHAAGQLDDAAMVQQMYLAMARMSMRMGCLERAVQEMEAARQALPSAMVLELSYYDAADYMHEEGKLRAHGADAPAFLDYAIAAYYAYALLLVYRARTLTDSPGNFDHCQHAWERLGQYLEETRRYPAALAAYRQARQLTWRGGHKKDVRRIDDVLRFVQTMIGSRHGRVLPESALRAVFRGIGDFPMAELMDVPAPVDKDGNPVRLSVATDGGDE